MDPDPRLSRAQLVDRFRAHAKAHGYVSTVSLHTHDPAALRSVPLHFVGIEAARRAAGVPGPPYQKPRRKTGPKPGATIKVPQPKWSQELVIAELRRLHRDGHRLAHADLVRGGFGYLIGAASAHAGGLRHARALAGVAAPARRVARKRRTEEDIIGAIKLRARRGKPLAASRVAQDLVTAARWRFGSWRAALVVAGVDPEGVRVSRRIYTRERIIKILRQEARHGSDLRAVNLSRVMKLEAVQREFGTLRNAIVAAGLGRVLEQRAHGLQKWSRQRVIDVLRARASRGETKLTPGLHRVVQLFFGGADAARKAAGVGRYQAKPSARIRKRGVLGSEGRR